MIVKSLKLSNVRAIRAAEFRFVPGFNLIIGVNGVGKTTVLESLSMTLAAFSRHINGVKGLPQGFSDADIRGKSRELTIDAGVSFASGLYTHVIRRSRSAGSRRGARVSALGKRLGEAPSMSAFLGERPPLADGRKVRHPLGILFSTRRAIPSDRALKMSAASGGYAAAFFEAFSARELRLGEFSAWMRAQSELAAERAGSRRMLSALEKSVQRFLPGYTGLRVGGGRVPILLIKRDGVEIPVRQLSDGERGSLALVLDLTRRLAQANPDLDDPAARGAGVVLIDELDLHLHPDWQRKIVRNLTETFPALQFIATTHSPQVIGEVESSRIQIIESDAVSSPTHSRGVDSSRILEEVMDALPRSSEVRDMLLEFSVHIAARKMASARGIARALETRLGEGDAEVIRVRTLLDFLGGEA